MEFEFKKPKKLESDGAGDERGINRRKFIKFLAGGASAYFVSKTGAFDLLFGGGDKEGKRTENTLIHNPMDIIGLEAYSAHWEEEINIDDELEKNHKYLEKFKEKPQVKAAEEKVQNSFRNLKLSGEIYPYGIKGDYATFGKFERALRYKALTDLIEKKYNLPHGILFAMFLQESSGRDILLNALGDGGAGILHMQGILAHKYGLKVLGYDEKRAREAGVRDSLLGRALKEKVKEYKENVTRLSHVDDRFNPLLNLDAAARMLTTYIHGKKIEGLGPLRTAIRRYAGKYNYKKYYEKLIYFMTLMNNVEFIQAVEDHFNENNKHLLINGKKTENPFREYIEAHQKAIYENLSVDDYVKNNNERFVSKRTQNILDTYANFFIKPEREDVKAFLKRVEEDRKERK